MRNDKDINGTIKKAINTYIRKGKKRIDLVTIAKGKMNDTRHEPKDSQSALTDSSREPGKERMEEEGSEYETFNFFDSEIGKAMKELEFPSSMKETWEKQKKIRGKEGALVPARYTGKKPKGLRNLPPSQKEKEKDNDEISSSCSIEEDLCNIFQGGELKRPPWQISTCPSMISTPMS